jgi:hypothetical protein
MESLAVRRAARNQALEVLVVAVRQEAPDTIDGHAGELVPE